MTHAYLSDAQSTIALLSEWRKAGAIRAVDFAFAKGLCAIGQERGFDVDPFTVLMAAVCSLHLSDGHVCIDLGKVFSAPDDYLPIPDNAPKTLVSLASILSQTHVEACISALSQCKTVTVSGQDTAPLALKGQRLYLLRFYQYEERIAQAVTLRVAPLMAFTDASDRASTLLRQALEVLFKDDDMSLSSSQMLACAIGARSRFAIVTGGPGTGKTSTVLRLLAALQSIASETNGEKLRIALGAPTGKAAARLSQSIRDSVAKLPYNELPGNVTEHDIPSEVTTLHRLLGSRPNTRQFVHNQRNPLIIDVLVIDEASMVDVSLMASVVQALKHQTRLILLGDKDQLASVDAGAVLGQLAKDADDAQYNQATRAWLHSVTGIELAGASGQEEVPVLAQNVAMLTHSFRFDANSGIGQLAQMVNHGKPDHALLKRFKDNTLADAIWLIDDISSQAIIEHAKSGTVERFIKDGSIDAAEQHGPHPSPVGYSAYLSLLKSAQGRFDEDTPEQQWNDFAKQVLTCFERFQVLCAMRQGPYGVQAINQLIESALIDKDTLKQEGSFYQGRPVLMTRNDYNLGLKNGDVGIVIKRWVQTSTGPAFVPRVAFPSDKDDTSVRWFSVSRLQSLETVFAMTVHKSQGSEFEHACLILPDKVNAVVTKELTYTAITRAKRFLSIVSPNTKVLTDAIENPIHRESGLML
ncbi:exodeoxyribonuclease V subunit alpha [Glaciecola sp. XM2]|uniref:exodeoxyribonuclease V subunit alpha n=1 Tax=Glaciecola sp. XM2 TaxID=1914931 RepID=UPI001BDF4D26|nr:exodeoxyribonuclease V subunit alpha [Glaciecola sp. XM2]MBT1449751.1 exodeoxyribonuclease V subunit alpha [Glaciecola sp. XM2]